MTYIPVSGSGGPGFAANFGDYAGLQRVAFGIDDDGNLHITGTLNYIPAAAAMSPAQIFFTLPTGYRPTNTQLFGVTINGFSNQFALITVLPSGGVGIGTSELMDWCPLGHLVVVR